MHELLGVSDGGTEHLTDGLMAEADAQNRDFSGQTADHILADTGVGGFAGAGGEDDAAGSQRFDLRRRQLVIADDLDVRVDGAYQLIEIV